jgi:nucleoid DNA-binding protein
MTQEEFKEIKIEMSKRLYITQIAAGQATRLLFILVSKLIQKSGYVYIKGFGKFEVKQINRRPMKNEKIVKPKIIFTPFFELQNTIKD